MSKLYTKLAKVYHNMYQNIFDYEKEFGFYDKILKKNKSRRILEIGCGSGNLAKYFLQEEYKYTGMDLSKNMLAIAKKVEPKANFVQSDMRKMRFKKKFDAIMITGRSFSYLTKNKDVQKTLDSVYMNLKRGGVLIFDNFNAEKIISLKKKKFRHESELHGVKYCRISTKTPNLKYGWTENWSANYSIKEKGRKTRTIRDKSVLRSFTIDEIGLFLKLAGFELEDIINDDPIFTIVAKK